MDIKYSIDNIIPEKQTTMKTSNINEDIIFPSRKDESNTVNKFNEYFIKSIEEITESVEKYL